jgi:hypothetical protein
MDDRGRFIAKNRQMSFYGCGVDAEEKADSLRAISGAVLMN